MKKPAIAKKTVNLSSLALFSKENKNVYNLLIFNILQQQGTNKILNKALYRLQNKLSLGRKRKNYEPNIRTMCTDDCADQSFHYGTEIRNTAL